MLRWLPVVAFAVGLPVPAAATTRPLPPAPAYAAEPVSLAACAPSDAPTARGDKLFRYPPSGETSQRENLPPVTALSWSIEGAPDITNMSRTITSVLEFNAIRFGQVDPNFASFLPGELYQEVYGRDLYTAAKGAQYLYPEAFIRSGAEEFLEHQLTAVTPNAEFARVPYPGPGAVQGYLTREGKGEKTTSVSDEEGSVIHLAHLYYRMKGGAAWLGCQLNGATVLERMNRAADALLDGRLHPPTGLIKRSHTTDWGDVRMQGGLVPTMADPIGETWTASIYDQAWIYQALRELAEMNRAANQPNTADRFEQTAAQIKDATNRLLWMPDKGYYRIHLHLTPLDHWFNEDNIVAIGNAVAVYAGLTDDNQNRLIMSALERARIRGGSSKPGLSLDPPYHEAFFKHHLQYESGRYQNGGQWDWWGGVQMTAEFEAGFSTLAWQHLDAVAREWSTHPNDIAEWQVPSTMSMQGSHQYTGAAGTTSEAVVRGAFGVDLTATSFRLQPRLGGRSAHLQLMQPATGRSLWYRQRLAGDTLVIQYSVGAGSDGTLAVLLPDGLTATTATLDGADQPLRLTATGQDRYADLGVVPAGAHVVRISLTSDTATRLQPAWGTGEVPGVIAAATDLTTTLRVYNDGGTAWRPQGQDATSFAYRWVPQQGSPFGEGTLNLPTTVEARQATDLPLQVPAPTQPGSYRLQVDLANPQQPAFAAGSGRRALDLPLLVTDRGNAGRLQAWTAPITVKAGIESNLGVVVHSDGNQSWGTRAELILTGRWLTADGVPYNDGQVQPERVGLRVFSPGESRYVAFSLPAPRRPGNYRLGVVLTDADRPVPLTVGGNYEVTVAP